VAQAAYKSGASITAQYALDQGRTVFAVPGMIDNSLSVGCHALLQQGAAVAANVQDILTELGDISVAPVMQQQEIVFKKQPESVSEAKATSTTELTQKAPVPALRYPADSIESRILNLCTKPCSTDEVAQQCAITCADAQHLLFDLQLDGLIQQNFAGQWIVCSIFTRN
jgi:DNA processing protein